VLLHPGAIVIRLFSFSVMFATTNVFQAILIFLQVVQVTLASDKGKMFYNIETWRHSYKNIFTDNVQIFVSN
jgi:hypothetical protein